MTDYVFVWEDAPGDTHGFDPVVRAANGVGVTNPAGFNYESNYAQWCKAFGRPLPAWTYTYPGDDGAKAGQALRTAAPDAPLYVVDVEDAGVTQAQLETLIAQLPTAIPVYLSTYGTVSQCDTRQIPYRARGLDGIWPQTYYATQLDGIAEWRADHFTTWPTFSPADCAAWVSSADAGPCSIWRYGVTDLAGAATALASRRAALAAQTPVGVSMAVDIDPYVDRINTLARDGHLDDFFRRLLTIHRDQYGGESLVQNVAAIKASTATIAAEETGPGGAE